MDLTTLDSAVVYTILWSFGIFLMITPARFLRAASILGTILASGGIVSYIMSRYDFGYVDQIPAVLGTMTVIGIVLYFYYERLFWFPIPLCLYSTCTNFGAWWWLSAGIVFCMIILTSLFVLICFDTFQDRYNSNRQWLQAIPVSALGSYCCATATLHFVQWKEYNQDIWYIRPEGWWGEGLFWLYAITSFILSVIHNKCERNRQEREQANRMLQYHNNENQRDTNVELPDSNAAILPVAIETTHVTGVNYMRSGSASVNNDTVYHRPVDIPDQSQTTTIISSSNSFKRHRHKHHKKNKKKDRHEHSDRLQEYDMKPLRISSSSPSCKHDTEPDSSTQDRHNLNVIEDREDLQSDVDTNAIATTTVRTISIHESLLLQVPSVTDSHSDSDSE